MKPAPFEYCRADTLDEALDLVAEFGSDAAVLAGGMSLGPMLNMRLARPAAIVDVNPVADLSGIRLVGDAVETGALCRQADALDSALVGDDVPLLARALPFVGHFQTRNRGTLGGSVCHADPSAEIPLPWQRSAATWSSGKRAGCAPSPRTTSSRGFSPPSASPTRS